MLDANESPLMTWGNVEATPLRIENKRFTY